MLNPFDRGAAPHPLVVGMTGVKLGERFAQIGCAHGGRLGAIAAKVGLSGRAVAIVPDRASAAGARKGAADAGALVEVETAPTTALPVEEDGFDLVVIDDTAGLLGSMQPDARDGTVLEARRILRPGGRLIVIGSARRTGLGALLSRPQAGVAVDPTPAFHAGGFKSVRTLGEREGLTFVEGMKPRPVAV
ncbi:MAG: methyltransferase domain-containing protein [Acidobacteriota bacterium]